MSTHAKLTARVSTRNECIARISRKSEGKSRRFLKEKVMRFNYYIFFGLKRMFKTPLNKPMTVKVPPIKAHIDVTNSYHRLPFREIITAIGEIS